MYLKRIPIELAVIAAQDPCNSVEGFFFIWTPITRLDAVQKEHGRKRAWKRERMNHVMSLHGRTYSVDHVKNLGVKN